MSLLILEKVMSRIRIVAIYRYMVTGTVLRLRYQYPVVSITSTGSQRTVPLPVSEIIITFHHLSITVTGSALAVYRQ